MITSCRILTTLYSVRTSVNPNPHNAVNRTHSGFKAYEVLMYFFGFAWGIANCYAIAFYYLGTFSVWDMSRRPKWLNYLFLFFQVFVVGPAAIALIIFPFFGGWIFVAIAQKVSSPGPFCDP